MRMHRSSSPRRCGICAPRIPSLRNLPTPYTPLKAKVLEIRLPLPRSLAPHWARSGLCLEMALIGRRCAGHDLPESHRARLPAVTRSCWRSLAGCCGPRHDAALSRKRRRAPQQPHVKISAIDLDISSPGVARDHGPSGVREPARRQRAGVAGARVRPITQVFQEPRLLPSGRALDVQARPARRRPLGGAVKRKFFCSTASELSHRRPTSTPVSQRHAPAGGARRHRRDGA